MLTATEAIPTVEEIEKIINNTGNFFSSGVYRRVYRKGESKWIIKVDDCDGDVNQREYDNREKLAPSLSNPSLRFPEMHMVGEYLVAEYIEGNSGNMWCWNSDIKYRNGKAHYTAGCGNENCTQGINCWAEVTKEVSEHVADIHYANVKITKDGTIYVIDLGEH